MKPEEEQNKWKGDIWWEGNRSGRLVVKVDWLIQKRRAKRASRGDQKP